MWFLQEALDLTLVAMTTCRMRWDTERMQPDLQVQPIHLPGAMYLQLAQSVAPRTKYQRCASCRRWFEVAPGVSRSDRLTCSAACRQRGHRERVRRARELHAQGKRPQQIANLLGSEIEAVRHWIAGDKGE
jgi:hypothetical protein